MRFVLYKDLLCWVFLIHKQENKQTVGDTKERLLLVMKGLQVLQSKNKVITNTKLNYQSMPIYSNQSFPCKSIKSRLLGGNPEIRISVCLCRYSKDRNIFIEV